MDFTLQENLRGFELTFKTTYDLFSYKHIDEGTRLLINTMQLNEGDACLDLGCGYGSIGIVMAKLNPKGKVYLLDRDFVATEYSEENCKINDIKNYEVRLSNGLSRVKDITFNTIASNLPTHIARESLEHILHDANQQLTTKGSFYFVSTTRLRPFIQKLVSPVFKSYEKIAQNANYTVSLVKK